MTVEDLLADLDDVKSGLYDMVAAGQLDENTNDMVQELLREAYTLLEG